MRLIFTFIFVILTSNNFAQSTASKSIVKFTIDSEQLKTTKTIWVYLPVSYETDSISYPVVYMFDGQNLFDKETSYVGEWKVDEYLDSSKMNVIIVGIEHGNEKRIDELTPFTNKKHGGGKANDMLNFVVETLKPEIDRKYRTKSESSNTTIAGSSLGGLTAFYAAIKYSDTFGNAGVFSPSFWINPELYNFVNSNDISRKSKFYFAAGTDEGESMVPDLEKMVSTLTENGVSLKKLETNIIADAKHNEQFWSSQFPAFMEWLMSQKTNKFLNTN